MKKILFIFLAVWLSACNNISDFNADPKHATAVPAGTLFINAQKNLSDGMASTNVNDNIFRLLSQQWTETTYTDEANYNLTGRTIPQNWWHRMYRDVLKDLDEAKRIVEANEKLSASQKATQIAMTEILSVYTYSVLVNTFGNIPYTEALNIENLEPVYDDAATVHGALITRLDAAIADLSGGDAGDFATYDVFYAGNTSGWLMFANSLKLRLGMTLADADPSKAKSTVESAAAGVFKSNADNAAFNYLAATPNTNPLWVSIVQSGRKDFVGADTYINALNAVDDPRRPIYFTPSANGVTFVGGVYGANNNYAAFSKPGAFASDPTTEGLLMDYTEVEFYLAEAAARGMSVGGTAAEHYTAGITASMEYWGVSDADIATYLGQSSVAYSSAQGDFKEKIGMQKWFALYNRGFESWTEWRRLDYPALVAPPTADTDIPRRYTYPISEQNLNTAQYDAASSAIGGDVVDTKIFWDMQ